jgi:hypothetical protein
MRITPTIDDVRARAHRIWILAGQPEGESLHHWNLALAQLGMLPDVGKEPDGEASLEIWLRWKIQKEENTAIHEQAKVVLPQVVREIYRDSGTQAPRSDWNVGFHQTLQENARARLHAFKEVLAKLGELRGDF